MTLVGDLAELARREARERGRSGLTRRNWHWVYIQLRHIIEKITSGFEGA